MAEALLFDLTKLVVRQLGSDLFNEVKLVLGVDDKLDKINNNLLNIQAVLTDAEKQQSTSESVKNWLQKLQDVVYDIDDLLDEVATDVALQNKNKGHMCRQVRKFFSRSNIALLRLKWVSQIKDVHKKLDRVAEQRKSFVLFSEPTIDSLGSSSRETYSKPNEYKILGRDQDRESIIDLILSCRDCERISVLPIVGMGGIGKTTLAKLIYNDERIDGNFDNKLWVYVSQRFNMKKILRQIISVVTGEKIVQLTMENLSLEELSIRVCEALKDKKYFLLLDDMWNEDSNEWRQLKEILDVGVQGSMMVVTTRDLKVASMVKVSVEEYKLSELSDETCLRIFTQLAFKDGEEIDPVLMSLSNEIVEKSRGIPFLITNLGNLLCGRTDEREWNLVIKKLEEGHEDIMNILKLSYEQLPSYLKQCFRFFSIFGKGTPILVYCFPYYWSALGFLPVDNREEVLESPESIGWKCINELVSKSLFQRTKDGLFEFSELSMHDFVYDLAKFAAGDELEIVNRDTKKVSKNNRYICLDEDYLFGNQSPERILSKAKKARLLMVKTFEHPLSKSFLEKIISNLKFIRVLDLENCQFEELPRTIGYMKHLRFLCLQNNERIKFLPSSISNLVNLQFLAFDRCINLKKIRTNIGRLENLRVLTVTTQQEVLPQDIGCLTSLRYLLLQSCPRLAFLPLSIMHLVHLDILEIVNCEELSLEHDSWSLEGMDSLRVLIITGLPKLKTLPLGGKGIPFTSLHHLMIDDCEGLTEATDWIQNLTSLKTLIIYNLPNLVILPHTFNKHKRLEKLDIEGYPDLEI